MRGLGAFQRAQMRDTDPRIHELFVHLRHALDTFEQIMLRPQRPAAEPAQEAGNEKSAPAAPAIPADDPKLAYRVKEICKLVGVSVGTLYRVIWPAGAEDGETGRQDIDLGYGPSGVAGKAAIGAAMITRRR